MQSKKKENTESCALVVRELQIAKDFYNSFIFEITITFTYHTT